MTALRQRMLEDLRLRGFALKTQEAYLGAVRQLAIYYHKPPDQITEEELRQYFLYLKDVKRVSRSTCTIALSGIKFFYQQTLRRDRLRPLGVGTRSISSDPQKRRNYQSCSAWPKFNEC